MHKKSYKKNLGIAQTSCKALSNRKKRTKIRKGTMKRNMQLVHVVWLGSARVDSFQKGQTYISKESFQQTPRAQDYVYEDQCSKQPNTHA